VGKAISRRRARPKLYYLVGFLDLWLAFCLDLQKKEEALSYLKHRMQEKGHEPPAFQEV